MGIQIYAFLIIASLSFQQFHKGRLLIEVSNNGARSPLTPNNFTKDAWAKDHLHGEITNVGLRSHYLLGRALRKFYVDIGLIPERYNTDQIVAVAAPYSSAESSAYAQLMGMYSPGLGPALSEIQQGIAFPPVEDVATAQEVVTSLKDRALPYYSNAFSVSRHNNLLFNTISDCNYLKENIMRFFENETFKALNKSYEQLYSDIEKKNPALNGKMNLTTAFLLYDSYICDIHDERQMNIVLSADDVYNLSKLHVDYMKKAIYENVTTVKASIHMMIHYWIGLFNDMVEKDNINSLQNSTRMVLLSGVVTTMYPLLIALGMDVKEPVEFASTLLLLIDVTKETAPFTLNDYEINIRRDGKPVESVLGLKQSPTVKEFVDALLKIDIDFAPFNVKNLTEFCKIHYTPPPTPPTPEAGLKYKHVMWILFGISLFLIVLSWVIVHLKDTIKEMILAANKTTETDQTLGS